MSSPPPRSTAARATAQPTPRQPSDHHANRREATLRRGSPGAPGVTTFLLVSAIVMGLLTSPLVAGPVAATPENVTTVASPGDGAVAVPPWDATAAASPGTATLVASEEGTVLSLPGTGPAGAPGCDRDARDHLLEDRAGDDPFVDHLTNGSMADWDGGEIVRVGASGDCSLAVTNGTATLTASTVNGTGGVVTGTVDLGENGSLRLVDGNVTALALRNVGPSYDPTVAVVANGTVRDRIRTPTGRFFDFLVRTDPDGTVRVAVWAPDEEWDREWDVTIDGTSSVTREQWRVQLGSETFVDEIAIGTASTGSETPTPESTPTGTDTPDGMFDDEEFPSPAADEDDRPSSADSGSEGVGLAVLAALVGGIGYRYAYGLARFQEQMDAIGSTTPPEEVEPAGWRVALTRLLFGGLAVGSVLWLAVQLFGSIA